MAPLNSLLNQAQTFSGGGEDRRPQPASSAEENHSLVYASIFFFVGTGAATFLSYALSSLHASPSGLRLVVAGMAVIALLIIAIFQYALVQSVRYCLILALIEGAALFSFLYASFSGWFVMGYLLYVITLLLGYRKAYHVLNDSMVVDFWHYASVMMRGVITAVALLLASVYVSMYQQAGGISFTAYRFIVSGTSPGLQYVAPNFSLDTSVDALVGDAVTNYFAKSGSPFAGLPEATRVQAVKEATPGILEQIQSFTKQAIQPGDTLVGYTFEWLTNFLRSLEARGFGSLVIASIFLIIFLSVKSGMFLLHWPVLLAVYLVYGLLKSIGIMTITVEPRPHEVLVVK